MVAGPGPGDQPFNSNDDHKCDRRCSAARRSLSGPKATAMNPSAARKLQKLELFSSILALFVLAMYVRMHFLVVRGGLEPDQIGWAMRSYFGGLSKIYLIMRDSLLAGRPGPQ